ncbi:hypothetical protein [Nafulsella turpanensis]|uniref:hypothetical protein n=1 Tax=Nafulsella turpanensis TaxID=1265690 RepID=UPI00037532B0|nr:hypothetical protein [Nafulsella turpanensis]
MTLLLLLTACSKDELTKPVEVNLQMLIEQEEVVTARISEKNTLNVEGGRYLLSGLEFEGYRESGEDYFFSKEFEDGLEADLQAGRPSAVFAFDMPQGVYQRISMALHIKKAEVDDEKEEDDDKPFNEDASLILNGYYTNSREEQIPFIFVYNFDDTFEYSLPVTGAEEVVSISNGRNTSAKIRFNPSYWLQQVNGRMLQSANLIEVEGEPTILISENSNEHIFSLLSSRIEKASDLTFE